MKQLTEYITSKLGKSDSEFIKINKSMVHDFYDKVKELVFPEICTDLQLNSILQDACSKLVEVKIVEMTEILKQILRQINSQSNYDNLIEEFLNFIPGLSEKLREDAKAILNNDPAAHSLEEVIFCYPGINAICAYRIANFFYFKHVNVLPRLLTEIAHSQTGIDIHPGAMIGERFCIDHGTGIVIGETSIIGNDVTIYQGVTIGALNVNKALANKKRHPTIENNCIIYSNATILGGDTVIGEHSIIGGNVWITKSVKPYTRVYYKSQSLYEYNYNHKDSIDHSLSEEINYEI